MNKIIVTGAAGFIGSHLAEELVNRGHNVYGVDNFHPFYSREIKEDNLSQLRDEDNFSFIEGDILSDKTLDKLPKNPKAIFHQAAVAGVRNSIKNPTEYTRQNVLATSKILERYKDSKIIFASSSSVYGEKNLEELPVKENDCLDPIAPYPLSKVQCEQMIELYSDLYGIDYSILRYFTAYGPRQRPDEAFTKFLSQALNGKPITIYGDGEQSRDFTHVSDIVQGNIKALERGEGTYNIASGRRKTVNELVQAIQEVYNGKIEKKHLEQPEGDVRHTHGDITKAREELGYETQKKFSSGVEECLKWCKRMKDKGIL